MKTYAGKRQLDLGKEGENKTEFRLIYLKNSTPGMLYSSGGGGSGKTRVGNIEKKNPLNLWVPTTTTTVVCDDHDRETTKTKSTVQKAKLPSTSSETTMKPTQIQIQILRPPVKSTVPVVDLSSEKNRTRTVDE